MGEHQFLHKSWEREDIFEIELPFTSRRYLANDFYKLSESVKSNDTSSSFKPLINSPKSLNICISGEMKNSDEKRVVNERLNCRQPPFVHDAKGNRNLNASLSNYTEIVSEPMNLARYKELSQQSTALSIQKKKLSLSLHDVSLYQSFPLNSRSCSVLSTETVQSHSFSSTTKSKDSGFHRSVSCLSLNSGNRSYDHVQSKVKEYIRHIKEAEALRRKQKQFLINQKNISRERVVNTTDLVILDKDELLDTIVRLKQDLLEKENSLGILQRSHNALLLKYAEAENRIDELRLKSISNNFMDVELPMSRSRSFLCNSEGVMESYGNTVVNYPLYCQDSIQQKRNKIENNDRSDKDITSCLVPLEYITTSNQYFLPSIHSTPNSKESLTYHKKKLGPVNKIYSSSVRIDQKVVALPVNNFIAQIESVETPGDTSTCRRNVSNDQHSCGFTVPISTLEGEVSGSWLEFTKQKKTGSLCGFNLPNDDPHSKVMRWQKSLPNIDLLSTDNILSSRKRGSGTKRCVVSTENINVKKCTKYLKNSGFPERNFSPHDLYLNQSEHSNSAEKGFRPQQGSMKVVTLNDNDCKSEVNDQFPEKSNDSSLVCENYRRKQNILLRGLNWKLPVASLEALSQDEGSSTNLPLSTETYKFENWKNHENYDSSSISSSVLSSSFSKSLRNLNLIHGNMEKVMNTCSQLDCIKQPHNKNELVLNQNYTKTVPRQICKFTIKNLNEEAKMNSLTSCQSRSTVESKSTHYKIMHSRSWSEPRSRDATSALTKQRLSVTSPYRRCTQSSRKFVPLKRFTEQSVQTAAGLSLSSQNNMSVHDSSKAYSVSQMKKAKLLKCLEEMEQDLGLAYGLSSVYL